MPENPDSPEQQRTTDSDQDHSDSTIPKTEISQESMEVHHHPDLHHEKKKWKEYFLEFLMIFLAVSLGFIADNIRESISEHERAKVYAVSMLKDLEEDTAQLRSYRSYFDFAAKNVDTLMNLLNLNDAKNIQSGKLYWYGLWGGAHRYFIPNDATFQQMKNSGSLRFFEKTVAYDAANYDRLCRVMQTSEASFSGIFVETRKLRAQIFESRYNEQANNLAQSRRTPFFRQRLDSFMQSNPPILNYDKILFNQYLEMVRSRYMHGNVSLADSLLNASEKLIVELKRNYGQGND
jgi:hypothetical protein